MLKSVAARVLVLARRNLGMLEITGSVSTQLRRQRLLGASELIVLSCLSASPLQAQDWMGGVSPWSDFSNPMAPSIPTSPMGPQALSPWSSYSAPMTQSPWSSSPSSYGSPFGNQWPGQAAFPTPSSQPPYSRWPTPYSGQPGACPDTQPVDSHQPDLTGHWRGSGGESVEVQRNYARIWGGQDKPCNCIFFLVGQRLIAYSPDTDVVRKYWYQSGGNNQFTLIDESGNVMTYQRTR
jgi:hypothetical protein